MALMLCNIVAATGHVSAYVASQPVLRGGRCRSPVIRMNVVSSWYDNGLRLEPVPQAASEVTADPGAYPTEALLALGGYGPETGGIWDPWKLASSRFTTDPSAIYWYRAAEIKHGRIAMAACVGWLISIAGITFNGNLAPGLPFADVLGADPLETWANVPIEGKEQMLLTIGLIEITHETENQRGGKHYIQKMRDGEPMGSVPVPFGWDPLKLMRNYGGARMKSDESRRQSLVSELKNGRLAMIGIASFYAASQIPGSVPLLN